MNKTMQINGVLNKIAEINVLMTAALDANAKWQKDFIKEEWIKCRQALINEVVDIIGGENE